MAKASLIGLITQGPELQHSATLKNSVQNMSAKIKLFG